jgi:hypothetical protein
VAQDFHWMNDIPDIDTEHRAHTLSVMDGQPKTTRFRWVSNFNVTPTTVLTLANQGGRLRWKIENEGFNVQKHGGYALEHAYTQNPTAAKVFYFLLPIAHLLSQLTHAVQCSRRYFLTVSRVPARRPILRCPARLVKAVREIKCAYLFQPCSSHFSRREKSPPMKADSSSLRPLGRT